MSKKFSFKQVTNGEFSRCWFCSNKTYFILTDLQKGDEIWCCSECALENAQIKRLKSLLRNHSIKRKSSILESNSLIKKRKVGISEGGCE